MSLDAIRAELVRANAFNKASATQLSKVLALVDAAIAVPAPVPAPEPIPEPVPEPTPAPESGELLFVADAETGDTSQWCYVHSAVPVGVVTSPVRDGRYAYKCECQDGALIFGTERSEYANGPGECALYRYKDGEENFTAFSVYPETDFPNYTHWSLCAQFKGPHTGTPPLQLSLRGDQWGVYGNGRIEPRPFWPIGPMTRGAWNDFVFHVKWSPDPAIGWFAVYLNGQIAIPKTFTSTMYLDAGVATPLFLSVGHYRDSGPATGTAILYVDAVKVGTSLSVVTPA